MDEIWHLVREEAIKAQGGRRKGERTVSVGLAVRGPARRTWSEGAVRTLFRYSPLLLLAIAWELAARLHLVSSTHCRPFQPWSVPGSA